MKYLLIGFVKLWRWAISPLYGNVCKYYPSCSAYGLEALQTHGALKGSWLIVRRLGHCHPWSKGGYDPVPGTRAAAEWAIELAELKARAREAAAVRTPGTGAAGGTESEDGGEPRPSGRRGAVVVGWRAARMRDCHAVGGKA